MIRTMFVVGCVGGSSLPLLEGVRLLSLITTVASSASRSAVCKCSCEYRKLEVGLDGKLHVN